MTKTSVWIAPLEVWDARLKDDRIKEVIGPDVRQLGRKFGESTLNRDQISGAVASRHNLGFKEWGPISVGGNYSQRIGQMKTWK